MTLLDLEKGFDKVWHEALLHKLLVDKAPNFLVKITRSFLMDRESFVFLEGKTSGRMVIPAGVPQGSPLSPHLFIRFINDVPVPRKCKMAIFADDTALTSSVKNYDLESLVQALEEGLAMVQAHFESWKMCLNQQKTEVILFTKSSRMIKDRAEHKIHFGGEQLEWSDAVKYLGVTLDAKLLFKHHIELSLKKSNGAIALLYSMLKKHNSLPIKQKLSMYRTYIRPILTYACPVFSHCAKTHKQKLQTFQNKCLRMALSAEYCTRIADLHRESRIPTIDQFVGKLTENFYKRCDSSSNKLIKRLGAVPVSHLASLKHRMPRR